jgi:hypothetical protein
LPLHQGTTTSVAQTTARDVGYGAKSLKTLVISLGMLFAFCIARAMPIAPRQQANHRDAP